MLMCGKHAQLLWGESRTTINKRSDNRQVCPGQVHTVQCNLH